MSRADEPTVLPDEDDEITTDVDPAWVAGIRAETRGSASSPAAEDDEAGGGDRVDDWSRAEPMWDPEATVGASDGLIERIRQEVSAAPSRPVAAPTPGPPAPPPPASSASSATDRAAAVPPPPPPIVERPVAAVPAHESTARDAPSAVEIPFAAAVPSVDELTSTTVRWEPRQRLAATAPVTETPLITQSTHHVLDRTKIVIALIVAVALVIVVWLVVGSRGSDDPAPPVDSVPTSDGTGSIAPTPSAPVDPGDVGG